MLYFDGKMAELFLATTSMGIRLIVKLNFSLLIVGSRRPSYSNNIVHRAI